MAVATKKRKRRVGVADVVIIRDVERARVPASRIRVVLTSILKDESRTGTVQVVVVDDSTIRRLNRRFKGHDKATDVLSFPFDAAMPGTETMLIIGEIYCNYSHCKRWSKTNGGTVADELLRLAVHGCLHLLGYDHHKPADQSRMLSVENRYIDQGGLIRARVTAGAEFERV